MDGVARVGRHVPDGSVGRDPRALRGGNVPSVFAIAHWLRDRRLSFTRTHATLRASECDTSGGDLPIADAGERVDVVIVGSGLSGLAAAFYLTRRRPGTRVLILDCKPAFGGNAGRDDQAPLPVPAATAGLYGVEPKADFILELYDAIGFAWDEHVVPAPFYSYFFDEHTPYVRPGCRGWALDVYSAGVSAMPYAPDILRDLTTAKRVFTEWASVPCGPMDPADWSDPRFAHLGELSLHDYLTTTLGLHPAVSDFYTRYAIDALGGTARDVNAFTAISFLNAEYQPVFSPPGGTSAIARRLVKCLIPASFDAEGDPLTTSIRSECLDQRDNPVRIRQNAMVLRVDTNERAGEVIYFSDGRLTRVSAGAVILAGQGYTTRLLVDHLIDEPTRKAWQEFVHVPVVTANVVLRSAKPLHELGLGYDNYWWGSRYWADFAVADWCTPRRFDPDRTTVLTFFGGNVQPAERMPDERVALLRTPFEVYEQSIREDLERILSGADFDFDRDVVGTYLYRWGHGLVFPTLGFPVRASNGADPNLAPRLVARRQVGRILFGGQDTEGSPSLEGAVTSGLRTAMEAIATLGP